MPGNMHDVVACGIHTSQLHDLYRRKRVIGRCDDFIVDGKMNRPAASFKYLPIVHVNAMMRTVMVGLAIVCLRFR